MSSQKDPFLNLKVSAECGPRLMSAGTITALSGNSFHGASRADSVPSMILHCLPSCPSEQQQAQQPGLHEEEWLHSKGQMSGADTRRTLSFLSGRLPFLCEWDSWSIWHRCEGQRPQTQPGHVCRTLIAQHSCSQVSIPECPFLKFHKCILEMGL